MKTSEFIKRVEALGYEVKKTSSITIEVMGKENTLALISEEISNRLDTIWYEEITHELFDLLVEYSRTPIDEREEEPKYYWVISSKYYLSSGKGDDYFTLRADVNKWYPYFKEASLMQQFTEKEFYKLEKELDIVGWFKRGERVE